MIITLFKPGWLLRASSATLKTFLQEASTFLLNTSVVSSGLAFDVSMFVMSTVGEARTRWSKEALSSSFLATSVALRCLNLESLSHTEL